MSISTSTFDSLPGAGAGCAPARCRGSRVGHPGLRERRAEAVAGEVVERRDRLPDVDDDDPVVGLAADVRDQPGGASCSPAMPRISFVRSYLAVVPPGTSSVMSTAISVASFEPALPAPSSSISAVAGTP